MSFFDELPKPFFVLAPMDDVTDTVFRQIVAGCAKPDLFITEFVNVDGLQSPGRKRLLHKLTLASEEGISRHSRLSGLQGATEQQSEPYMQYGERAAEDATQQSAKSASGAAGLASRQAGAAWKPRPIIAQLWGTKPENFYKTAKELVEMGFDGIDLNFGCPVKTVIKNGACAALINNRELAGEIIDATRAGAHSTGSGQAGKHFPVSVKTRVGFTTVDLSWIEFLLSKKLNLLSIHGRTAKQKSKVDADWDLIGLAREMRDVLCPSTKIVGNGDVLTRQQGLELAKKYKLDGIMIGRGIFNDPFVFAKDSPWASYTNQQKIDLYRKHVELFIETYEKPLASRAYGDAVQGNNEQRASRTKKYGERVAEAADEAMRPEQERIMGSARKQAHAIRPSRTLNKFCKIYINGFDGAKELREKLMSAKSTEELLSYL